MYKFLDILDNFPSSICGLHHSGSRPFIIIRDNIGSAEPMFLYLYEHLPSDHDYAYQTSPRKHTIQCFCTNLRKGERAQSESVPKALVLIHGVGK